MVAISGNDPRRLSTTCRYWPVTASLVVCAKIVEISALTGLERADPRRWVTLRAKCTRQRCQPAPGRIALTAALMPACASDVTKATPSGSASVATFRPALAQRAEELGPEVGGLRCPERYAEDLPAAVAGHAGRDDERLRDDPPADTDIKIGRVEEQVREPGVIDPTMQELVHLLVDLAADP